MKSPKGYQYLSTIAENETTIWRAKREETQDEVVIKTLNLKHVEDWKGIELFEREVATLKQLDHPAIPKFIDLIKDNDTNNEAIVPLGAKNEDSLQWHIVQEKVEGDTISNLIEQKTLFNETELISIATQVLDILIYLQDFSPPLFHRDIKPANLIMNEGNVFLIDFGSVRHVVPKAVGGSTIVGTNGYMAPEQLIGRADMSSDLFGLGMTLIHIITGQHPGDLTMKRMKIEWGDEARVKLGDGFARFLDRLSQPDPNKRFLTAVQARSAIDNLESDLFPQVLVAETQDVSDVVFVHLAHKTIVKKHTKYPVWIHLWIPFLAFFFVSISLAEMSPTLAFSGALTSVVGFAFLMIKITQIGNGLHISMGIVEGLLRVNSAMVSEDGIKQIHDFSFDDVLRLKTEMTIENTKEIKSPLVINQMAVTPPLTYADRSAIIEEMKATVRREAGGAKE